jgi:hypothetical protein
MNAISILGIDIAKNTFQLHGADSNGSFFLVRPWFGVRSEFFLYVVRPYGTN